MFAVNAQPNIVHRFASCRVIKVVCLISYSESKVLTCLVWVGMALLKNKVLFHRPFSYDQMAGCALCQSGSRELQLWPMSISGLFCVIPFSMIRLYENSYSRL